MELSGELISGYFFEDIPGPQFLALPAWTSFRELLPRPGLLDERRRPPVARRRAAGRAQRLASFQARQFPPRVLRRGTIAFFRAQWRRHRHRGRPEDSRLRQALDLFRHLLGRRVDPLSRIEMERINGEAASRSCFAPLLKEEFSTVTEWDKLILLRS